MEAGLYVAADGVRRSYICRAEESVARRRDCGVRVWTREGASGCWLLRRTGFRKDHAWKEGLESLPVLGNSDFERNLSGMHICDFDYPICTR